MLPAALLELRLLAPGGPVRRFSKMFSGMVIRLIVQMGYFVLLARFLGPAQYGMFVAAASTSLILSTLGGMGAEVMLPKSVSRGDLDLATGLRCALGNLLVGAPGLMISAFVITATVASPGLPLLATAAICLSDTVLFRLNGVVAAAHLSVDRIWRCMATQIAINVARLIAVIGTTLLLSSPSLLEWCFIYLAATAVASFCTLLPLWRELGTLRPLVRRDWLREGFFFALSSSAQVAYYEVDKPLIGRLISSEAAGLYAASTRITDAAFLPINSIVGVMVTRFFKHGARGARSSLALAKRVLPAVIGFGLLVPLAIVVAAPYVPWVLGRRYAAAQDIVLWLSFMPLITGCFFVMADVLSSTGKQALRSVVLLGCVCLKLPISYGMAERYGLIGCVWAMLVSSVLLVAITTGMVLLQVAREPTGVPAASPAA